jgi:RimJ/RimL family protein N-acetyltransferase
MERLPIHGSVMVADVRPVIRRPRTPGAARVVPGTDWRQVLPVLHGHIVTLREPRVSDATALWSMVSSEEVSRFMSAPPSSIDAFERFIAWTHRERAAGNFICFAVVPHGMDEPVGIFQIRRLDGPFETAEWGFAIGSGFWRTGVYADAAALVLEFAFNVIGARRLEARAAVENVRGNGALRKMGATREVVLHGTLEKDGQHLDQGLWTILDRDWQRARPVHSTRIH